MTRSRFLDGAKELVLVYPEVVRYNARGEKVIMPAETPVEVWVTTTADRGWDAELPGQVSVVIVKCYARTAPVGSWARIVYRGLDWDLAMPPRFSPGPTKATSHVEFRIRERNGVD